MFNFLKRKREAVQIISEPAASIFQQIESKVKENANSESAAARAAFHNTDEPDSKDIFLGVPLSTCKQIAAQYASLCTLDDVSKLLGMQEHEIKLTALHILIEKSKTKPKETYDFYFNHLNAITSWDLVDLTAPAIIGGFLQSRQNYPRDDLYRLAKSRNTWDRRIAIAATLTFVKNDSYTDAFNIAESYFNEQSTLVLKAAGKVLREIGKRNKHALIEFIAHNQTQIPQEMLNAAATNLSPQLKKTIRKETRILQKTD